MTQSDFDKQYYAEMEARRLARMIEHQEEFKQWLEKHPEVKLIDELAGFKVGDKVTFTNDYGLEFTGHTILGIDAEASYGRQIYLDTDCYWFSKNPSNLTKEG